jgi:hypothetical protein
MPRTRNSHQLRARPRMASLDTAPALVSGIDMSPTMTTPFVAGGWRYRGAATGECESPGMGDSLWRSADPEPSQTITHRVRPVYPPDATVGPRCCCRPSPTRCLALLGSSRQLIVGPEGSIAALAAAALVPLAEVAGEIDGLSGITLAVGVACLAPLLLLRWHAPKIPGPRCGRPAPRSQPGPRPGRPAGGSSPLRVMAASLDRSRT